MRLHQRVREFRIQLTVMHARTRMSCTIITNPANNYHKNATQPEWSASKPNARLKPTVKQDGRVWMECVLIGVLLLHVQWELNVLRGIVCGHICRIMIVRLFCVNREQSV